MGSHSERQDGKVADWSLLELVLSVVLLVDGLVCEIQLA